MKKACVLQLVIWSAFFALYVHVFRPYIDETPPLVIIAVLGSTFAMVFVGSLTKLYASLVDSAALSRCARGVAPRDGRLEAASGLITSESAPFLSPFRGKPCVAYEYDVKATREKTTASEWCGLGLVPSVIRSPSGPIRLLGFPILDAFPEAKLEDEDRARAEEFLRTAPATEAKGLAAVGTLASELGDALTDDDGVVLKDIRLSGAAPELAGKRATEKIVAVGTTVTALGTYSAARGGLVPRPGFAFQPVRLCPGDVPLARHTFVKKERGNAIAGIVLFLVLHAMLGIGFLIARANGAI